MGRQTSLLTFYNTNRAAQYVHTVGAHPKCISVRLMGQRVWSESACIYRWDVSLWEKIPDYILCSWIRVYAKDGVNDSTQYLLPNRWSLWHALRLCRTLKERIDGWYWHSLREPPLCLPGTGLWCWAIIYFMISKGTFSLSLKQDFSFT